MRQIVVIKRIFEYIQELIALGYNLFLISLKINFMYYNVLSQGQIMFSGFYEQCINFIDINQDRDPAMWIEEDNPSNQDQEDEDYWKNQHANDVADYFEE